MKIYEKIKPNENIKISKLFGIPVYEQTYNYLMSEKYQKFLGGIISTCKTSDEHGYHVEKNVKILGFTFFKRCDDGNNRTLFLFNKPIKKVSLLNIFKQKYIKYFDKKYDDIYILNSNAGEAYLFLTYALDAFLRKNDSKCPLLVATQKYHEEMIKLICPEMPYIYNDSIRCFIKGDRFEIDNQTFYIVFSHEHFMQTEIDIKNNPINTKHYFTSLLNRLDIDVKDISQRNLKLTSSSEQSMLEKVNKLNLNLDRFVFLAPEAKSCKVLDNEFWIELINYLKGNGFDIFVNLTNEIKDNFVSLADTEYKTCFLTYSEAYALAKRARRIILLRSGLAEFLLQTNVPMDVIYTRFRNRQYFNDMSVEQVFSGFNMSKLPNIKADNIHEYIICDTNTQRQCLESIKKGALAGENI